MQKSDCCIGGDVGVVLIPGGIQWLQPLLSWCRRSVTGPPNSWLTLGSKVGLTFKCRRSWKRRRTSPTWANWFPPSTPTHLNGYLQAKCGCGAVPLHMLYFISFSLYFFGSAVDEATAVKLLSNRNFWLGSRRCRTIKPSIRSRKIGSRLFLEA